MERLISGETILIHVSKLKINTLNKTETKTVDILSQDETVMRLPSLSNIVITLNKTEIKTVDILSQDETVTRLPSLFNIVIMYISCILCIPWRCIIHPAVPSTWCPVYPADICSVDEFLACDPSYLHGLHVGTKNTLGFIVQYN